MQAKLVSIGDSSKTRIFLSAGEASGDHYGAQIVAGLRAVLPEATFTGLGGREMRDAGQQQVVRVEEVAVMGITEVLRHVPSIFRRYRRLVRAIRIGRPDVAVLVDFPDVNFRLAKHLRRAGVPVVWFVSPQLWAWKRRRLRWVQGRVSRMLVIFPFEESFYRARGVEAIFVGHPLAELPLPASSREDFAAMAAVIPHDSSLTAEDEREGPGNESKTGDSRRSGPNPAKPWIALLPGSRVGEVLSNLPAMLGAAALLGDTYDFLLPVAHSITDRQLDRIRAELARASPLNAGAPRITLVSDAREALFHARAAVVASGTATVQAAVIGNPFVMVYRVSALTYRLARRLVRYPPEIAGERDRFGNLPIAMVNLIAGRRVVPELLNEQFTPEAVVAELRPLLAEGPARAQQIADLARVREALLPSGATSSTSQAVKEILSLLHR